MAYLLVLLVAAAVGAAAFRATLRQSAAPAAAARARPPVGVPVPASGHTFVSVTEVRETWESRLTGALGLVIAIVVGAVTLALGTYLGITFVVKLVNRSVG
jgi:hypothetical protein